MNITCQYFHLLPVSCFESNLNGEYFVNPTDNEYFRGIIWELWKGDYSLRAARMMVRPKDSFYNGAAGGGVFRGTSSAINDP